ncbi:MAG: ATPase domain-containing protein, partial [Thermoplasmata archaeon]
METSLDIKDESISTGDRWPVSSGKYNRDEKTYSKDPAQGTIVESQEDDKEDQNIKRVSSGIADLDPLIQGGFPEGKSCLVTGEAGLGKSIFCMQFVLRGLMDGEKAVYVAVD